MKREEMTRKFDAVDEGGKVYTICEFTEYVTAKTLNESAAEEGLHRLELEDGSCVDRVGDFYQVVNSGVILREIDLPK